MALVKVKVDLKGLSNVAIKFGDILSEAVGGLCRPWQITRVSAAEAESDRLKSLTQAKTQIEIGDLQRRALERFVQEEAQKQSNMEEIAGKALTQISEKARPDEVSRDWIVHFFDRCRLTSDEEMQNLWAKVLAGEAEQPNRFSKRTIDVLGTLEKSDAQLFEKLCRFVWQIKHMRVPILYGFDSEVVQKTGLSFGKLQHLGELGLISLREALEITLDWSPAQHVVSYFGRHVELTIPEKEGGAEFNMGKVFFSRVGLDLASICKVEPIDPYFEETIRIWLHKYRYKVTVVANPDQSQASGNPLDNLSITPPKPSLPVWG